ncbi:helix-turn-helix transcriptional regulator [Pseudohaliea rubra]|uniref:helix-turn-helix transcriptional regulator n=1 Tax=Pseudohaliea rubra TaxID=475795 RepID=UPI0005512332|nr:AlpA family phage regulatory protein [Pseudohaliea rubra]
MKSASKHDHSRTPSRLVRIGEVARMTGLSRSYIHALTADGRFPKSLALVPGGKSRAWVLSEVEEWMEQRIQERDQGLAAEVQASTEAAEDSKEVPHE